MKKLLEKEILLKKQMMRTLEAEEMLKRGGVPAEEILRQLGMPELEDKEDDQLAFDDQHDHSQHKTGTVIFTEGGDGNADRLFYELAGKEESGSEEEYDDEDEGEDGEIYPQQLQLEDY
mmetsp:Transcript_40985/g.30148  ORF Transcript_40985/g.30148 Transcript_40985/m.30148 type:complete len:119 (+) Transcript_40985:603-959(+)